MKTILTIAGFDPSSGAGVTADLAVIASCGCFGTACVTALTVQSTTGVRGVEATSEAVLRAMLTCLEEDLPVDGVKIGMLATEENVAVVCDYLKGVRASGRHVPVVLDPVLRSSSGRELLTPAGVSLLRERLLPLVDWVTPNLGELGILADRGVDLREAMESVARETVSRYRTLGVVAKGGHLEGGADDLVVDRSGEMTWLPGERVVSRATHGTGCAFSSAMVCGLAMGLTGVEAAREAKRFVTVAIRRATPKGRGTGAMNLYWPMRVDEG